MYFPKEEQKMLPVISQVLAEEVTLYLRAAWRVGEGREAIRDIAAVVALAALDDLLKPVKAKIVTSGVTASQTSNGNPKVDGTAIGGQANQGENQQNSQQTAGKPGAAQGGKMPEVTAQNAIVVLEAARLALVQAIRNSGGPGGDRDPLPLNQP